MFFGSIVDHLLLDPRDGRTMLAGVRTGHLGPTVFRSVDEGRTWKEAARPPAFPPGSEESVSAVFWLTRFPGLRFRIVDEHGRTRPHVHFFVGGQLARSLDRTVSPGDEIMIVCALSGG